MERIYINDSFLLQNQTAENLFHEYAESLPLIDYHNHIDPVCVVENFGFKNISQLWVNHDPYKHRAMRIAGVPEYYITGEASDKEKFMKWAQTVPQTLGNPLFHWTCLELKRIFGIDEILSANCAEDIWTICNEQLNGKSLGAAAILNKWNIDYLCTSDSPLDSLEAHLKFARRNCGFRMFPSLRGDLFLMVESFIKEYDGTIDSLNSYQEAVISRLNFFQQAGCSLADHSLDSDFIFNLPSTALANRIFQELTTGKVPDNQDIIKLNSYLLRFLGEEYARRKWVLQLHIGAYRFTSSRLRRLSGPAGGYACIGNACDINSMACFLDTLELNELLPKTILYTLNPVDNAKMASLTGSFAQDGFAGKVQFGPAWWYNDHYEGIIDQLETIGSYGLLSRFIGMTTDSRSILSFSRHEYFRRILCNMLGEWIEQGKLPGDIPLVGKMVQDISYNNIKGWL